MKTKVLAFLAAIALTACGGGGLFSSDIEYVVEGSAKTASVTYATNGGGTAQGDVAIPWRSSKSNFSDGQFMYISAQNNGNTGSVIVKIVSNGTVIKQTISSGAYVIATASGSCC
jgi:hypothetical protein